MATNILNTSTLSEALEKETNEFTVGSTASISVGNYLVIVGTAGLEAVSVQAIPVSGRVQVKRGIGGTAALRHRSGTRFFIGTPNDFQGLRNGVVAGFAGNGNDLPLYPLPGLKAFDGAGNEYVLVELTQTVVPFATVIISRDGNYTAAVMTSVSQGTVGVMAEGSSSDQYAWAQIWGRVDHGKMVGGSSLVTSLGEFWGASSVSTPAVGLLGRSSSQRSSAYGTDPVIFGMWPTSAASTASTSASSETGLFAGAWLQYPYINRVVTS